MAGPENAKVAVVKGGQLRLVKPLDYRGDPSVHKSHVVVSVTVTGFADTPVVFGLQFFDTIGAEPNVVKEGEKSPGCSRTCTQ